MLARGPVVTWASRTRLRTLSSLAFASFAQIALQPVATVRLAVHPGDVHKPSLLRSIEEASFSLGASSFTTFRRVVLPLILPAFFAGLGVTFIRAMTAISATIFLVSINWTLITVRILENMTELSLGPAAAFSVFVIVVVLIVTGILNLLLRRMTIPELRPSAVGD